MVLTWIQTVVLAVLQGVSEMLPISSMGHSVVIPAFLGWTRLVHSAPFLPVIVACHVGTSMALILALLLGHWRTLWRAVSPLQFLATQPFGVAA